MYILTSVGLNIFVFVFLTPQKQDFDLNAFNNNVSVLMGKLPFCHVFHSDYLANLYIFRSVFKFAYTVFAYFSELSR